MKQILYIIFGVTYAYASTKYKVKKSSSLSTTESVTIRCQLLLNRHALMTG